MSLYRYLHTMQIVSKRLVSGRVRPCILGFLKQRVLNHDFFMVLKKQVLITRLRKSGHREIEILLRTAATQQ